MTEYLHALLAYLNGEHRLSPSTVAAYRKDLLQFETYIGSEAEARTHHSSRFRVASIDRELISAYLVYLRDRGYSSASIARKTASLRAFFRYLRLKGEINRDPTLSVGVPDASIPTLPTVKEADLGALFAYCESRHTPAGMRDHAMLRMLNTTGMRVSELVSVNVSDVDFQSERVRVVGRGNRERMLPLDGATLAAIDDYLERARPLLTRWVPEQSALVVNQRGNRLTRSGFWLIMKRLVRDAGLPATITPNTLRRAFVSHQIGEGLGLEELRRLLGHASITTTQVLTQLPRSPVGAAGKG